MCIRDRNSIPQDLPENWEELDELADEWDEGEEAGTPKENCLLYTSDAADERSSVDLGGRRIIKKKNKVELRSRPTTRRKKKTNNAMQ